MEASLRSEKDGVKKSVSNLLTIKRWKRLFSFSVRERRRERCVTFISDRTLKSGGDFITRASYDKIGFGLCFLASPSPGYSPRLVTASAAAVADAAAAAAAAAAV